MTLNEGLVIVDWRRMHGKLSPAVLKCVAEHIEKYKNAALKSLHEGRENVASGVLFRWNTKNIISLLSSVAERHTMCEDVIQANLYYCLCYQFSVDCGV